MLQNGTFSLCCAENTNCLFPLGHFCTFLMFTLALFCFVVTLFWLPFCNQNSTYIVAWVWVAKSQRKTFKIMPAAKWVFFVFLAEPNQLWQRTDFMHLNISWAAEEGNGDNSVSLRSTLLFFLIRFYKYFCLLSCCDSVYVHLST